MTLSPNSASKESRLKFYKTTLCLAYQSFGVIYGDLSTSPIYVFRNTFSGSLRDQKEDHDIFGILSLVIWTLTIIPICKYMIFVLAADDNGEGGTFALYSLLCQHSKMGLLSNSDAAYQCLSSYSSEASSTRETTASLLIREFFEKHQSSRILLLVIVLFGTSMVIGDGVLTPTMSVLSAVQGVKIKIEPLHESYTVLLASTILVGLFALQHYGTHRVGFLFAPVVMAWLLCISGVGIYNILHWNPRVICAVSPYYIYEFFKKAGKPGWSALRGVVLCVTGAEAMFADLGHFSKLSIRVGFAVVFPCLVLAYMGEAAYLSKHGDDLQHSFYKAIPGSFETQVLYIAGLIFAASTSLLPCYSIPTEQIFWPVFVIATLATVVGSQAIISATFSIISQCRALRCFPRVKIINTSNEVHGQIYIPEINWMLMILCLTVVVRFRDTNSIGNAYGFAVITVMFVTTCLMFLVISTVWKHRIVLAVMFIIVFGSVELVYFSACLAKVHRGGWLPLTYSFSLLILMSIWHYGTIQKRAFELQNKVRLDSLLSLGPSLGLTRVPGIGFVYSDIASGVPPMFAHLVTNFPAFQRTLIFVTIQFLMVPRVQDEERFLIGRDGPSEVRIYRCTVRYGYRDAREGYDFETRLIREVMEFLKSESECQAMKELMEADESGGVVHMMGNTRVVARESSSYAKRVAINLVYGFLRRNCRRPAVALGVPQKCLIEVGMVYHV